MAPWTPLTAHTFATLDTYTAANSQAWISDPIANLNTGFGSITSWAPAITATGGTTPSGGAYTGTGLYVQTGNKVDVQFKIVTGAGWSAGTGTAWAFNLPVNADTSFSALSTGTARLAWGSNSTYGTPQLQSATTFRIIYMSSFTATAVVAAAAPGVWSASAEIINGSFTYFAA